MMFWWKRKLKQRFCRHKLKWQVGKSWATYVDGSGYNGSIRYVECTRCHKFWIGDMSDN